jgi:hypothetical protein
MLGVACQLLALGFVASWGWVLHALECWFVGWVEGAYVWIHGCGAHMASVLWVSCVCGFVDARRACSWVVWSRLLGTYGDLIVILDVSEGDLDVRLLIVFYYWVGPVN